MQTFSNTDVANLNDNTNIGFTPEKTYLVDGNDKIIVESFDSLRLGSFNITDPSVKDRDVLTVALSPEDRVAVDTNGKAEFGLLNSTNIKNIETIHIDTTGKITSISNNAKFDGIKTLELAGDVTAPYLEVNTFGNNSFNVSKIDASGITTGNVNLVAATDTTELVGGAGNDILTIGVAGGILTGNAGKDTFVVSVAKDNLVTITDVAKDDSVNFGSGTIRDGFNNNKAKELTITNASDETTFVDALQKAANKEASNGLYYAEFNGNTYVVANGQAGNNISGSVNLTVQLSSGSSMTLTSAVGALTPTVPNGSTIAQSALSSATITGTISLTGATVSAKTNLLASPIAIKVSAVSSVTGNVNFQLANNGGSYSIGVNGGSASAGSFTALGKAEKINLNGTEYSLSEFSDLSVSAGSKIGLVSFGVNGGNNGSSITSGVTSITAGHSVTLTGTTSVSLNGVQVEGVLAGDDVAMKDDIIVKLAGSHTLNTEATIADSVLTFA